jgi:hypothetical protein
MSEAIGAFVVLLVATAVIGLPRKNRRVFLDAMRRERP